MSHKAKMCKSPKSIVYSQSDKIEYENLNTNCTIVGSNNLHLVKKPHIVTSMSPVYSHPSPGGYPPSPYSSPVNMKSPSPQSMKPPTPQPNSFPVMQIIHNSHPVIARPIHTSQPQNVIKLKPPLNILPKPSASPQQSPKPSVSPQIVLPASQQATIMPTAQPLLLNQMPMLAPSVQFILRPQTKLPTQVQQTPQGLILQPSGQQLLQLQPPRSQPMVRVLTNGVPLPTTTYVTHMAPQSNIQPQQQHQPVTTPPQSISPKKKLHKKKKQKLDLANIMKLSGIGDDDDVQFESDASQSESEHNAHSQPATPQPTTPTMVQPTTHVDTKPKVGNIQISAVPQTINATGTPLVQVLNQTFQGGAGAQQPQQTSIPFSPFITPNFTINNGLMVQRSGGFKLALGEDGRLVLQHDPTLNQDLQSQLLLQSLFGLNGGLVLQPSIDQQIHSQTVQTIQQQSVQTIQQQTVQSQTIQTVQHQIVQPQTIQSIQSQIQGQIQSLLQQQNLGSQSIAIQPSNIALQPLQGLQSQPITLQTQSVTQSIPSHPIQSQSIAISSQPITMQSQSQTQNSHAILPNSQILTNSQPILTNSQPINQPIIQPISMHLQNSNHSSPVSSPPITTTPQPTITLSQSNQPILKVQPFQKTQPPVQTVHPIHHQSAQPQNPPPTSYVVNLTPDQLEQLKRNGQLTVNGQTIFMQRPNKSEEKKTSPKIKPMKKTVSKMHQIGKEGNKPMNNLTKTIDNVVKESVKLNVVTSKCSPVVTQASVQTQNKPQPSAIIQPQQNVQKLQFAQSKMHVPQQTGIIQPGVTQTGGMVQTNPVQSAAVPPAIGPIQQPNIPPTPVVQPTPQNHHPPTSNQDVERFLGQLMEETQVTNTISTQNNIVITSSAPIPTNPNQRVHTIQLTPQKQQHLKSIQLQIQTLSARLTPGNTEMQNALKLLFAEQQKILASGKLLSPDKVFYHNNQLIVNNSGLVKGNVPASPAVTSNINGPVENTVTVTAVQTPSVQTTPVLKHPVMPAPCETVPPHPIISVHQKPPVQPVTTQQPQNTQTRFIPLYAKAQLIEQQLNTDQNGAIKPDIHTPFRDKADACKRLIRYHCFEQPVLSQKDLDKADEIFELTARHFIDKFGRMVDKYRYLLHKESQRHVQTSELMMLDRMFLAEEQQSIMKIRQEIEECNLEMQEEEEALQRAIDSTQNVEAPPPTLPPPTPPMDQSTEEYDEWACIQRELGCLPDENKTPITSTATLTTSTITTTTVTSAITTSTSPSVKRPFNEVASRLESLKKFRVEKHVKKPTSMSVQPIQPPQEEIKVNRTIPPPARGTNGTTCTVTSSRTSTPTRNNYPVETSNMLHSYNSMMHIQNPMQRMHGMHGIHQNIHPIQHVVHNSTQQALLQRGMHNMQHYSTQHIVQHITHTVHHTTQQIQHSTGSVQNMHHSSSSTSYSTSTNEEIDNNDSIDEQVQSAIDSILNLQQNTSLELDETMQNMLS